MRKREVVALIFLIVGAGGIFLSVKGTAPQYEYLTAKRDIFPGEILESGDFRGVTLNLSDAAVAYVSAETDLNSHRSLRKIKSGEIIPRDAISRIKDIESRRLVTLSIEREKFSVNLKKGALVDLYFFSKPTLDVIPKPIELVETFPQVRIHELSTPTAQLEEKALFSILVEDANVARILELISTCTLSLSQRFDDE
jgi:hypothetical protein